MPPKTPIATLLVAFRSRAGLSQNALARRAGVSPAQVNRLEKGEQVSDGRGRRNPSGVTRRTLEKLIVALDLGPSDRDRLLHTAGYATLIDYQALVTTETT